MKQLKVAILWHQHQPYYKMGDEFILPWVRFHGIKDYLDLVEILYEFPDIHQTFNLAPSLMVQIEEYISGKTKDKIQRLTEKRVTDLTEADKKQILKSFFICNYENMILPYERYKQLFDKAQKGEDAFSSFSDQDWLDLQVWYNLTWFGPITREEKGIKRLFQKGKNFTEEEKQLLIDFDNETLSAIVPTLKKLYSLNQIEISVSPFYHPILPLLCDSKTALEAMPELELNGLDYRHPESAKYHIESAIDYYHSLFGFKPLGMWPSEGSLSDEVLKIMIDSGLQWTGTDEKLLENSLKDKYFHLEKYFKRSYKAENGKISLFFRDHYLSDAIGFVYSRWNSFDAANDFINKLKKIRSDIINHYGESALDFAVVPVILDGENCWEYYKNNGYEFLTDLYKLFTHSAELKTVKYSEILGQEDFLEPINHIQAGSWINGNFSIWIGHKDDRVAWQALSEAHSAVLTAKDALEAEPFEKALTEIHIAEGSDWFWWYGDEHTAENKADFDVMFRYHLSEAYQYIGAIVPDYLSYPLGKNGLIKQLVHPKGLITPKIDGRIYESEWDNAGYYDAKASMSAMHKVGELIHRIWFGSDEDNIYFRCDKTRKFQPDDYILFSFKSPKEFDIYIRKNSFEIISGDGIKINQLSVAKDEIIEFSLSKNTFFEGFLSVNKPMISIIIKTKTADGELFYPNQGTLDLIF
ncbi:MAG: glycoside hydrolase family 57 protein [Candidatus Kapabacteria bacterium]|nr:glycoside hydrolase family 57 protein [Candidatus Kapabacteria bacterium]